MRETKNVCDCCGVEVVEKDEESLSGWLWASVELNIIGQRGRNFHHFDICPKCHGYETKSRRMIYRELISKYLKKRKSRK